MNSVHTETSSVIAALRESNRLLSALPVTGDIVRAVCANDAAIAEATKLRAALECLLPGLILDLRYADEDDDKDALRSRIQTVREALTDETNLTSENNT